MAKPIIPGPPEHPGGGDGRAAFLGHGYRRPGPGFALQRREESIQKLRPGEGRRRHLVVGHDHVGLDGDSAADSGGQAELVNPVANDTGNEGRIIGVGPPQDDLRLLLHLPSFIS